MKEKTNNPPLPILIVDDEMQVLESYRSLLRYNGINNITLCQDSREVLNILERGNLSLIILDLFMPHITGEELLARIEKDYPQVPVIVITGSNKIETAVSCMKLGAFDYMVKPIENCRFLSCIKRGIEMQQLRQENSILRTHLFDENLKHPDIFKNIVTVNKNMHSILKYIEAIASSPRPVLITGESGVGKELIAASIHHLSCKLGTREDNYVTVNAAGLDDTLFSDTLFGHVKGAFTGANSIRAGLIEKARYGTLFLDEIGDLEAVSQIKLLRLLQENEYYRLGSDVPLISDARIIAATNMDLRKKQEEGSFRRDLFYRLNTHHIHIPPLRERVEDIPVLFEYFVNESCKTLNKPAPEIDPEVLNLLKSYTFPGNIRELQSITFDAVGRMTTDYLDASLILNNINIKESLIKTDKIHDKRISSISYSGDFPTMEMIEDFFVNEAMKMSNGSQTIAARYLGISQSTLSRRFKKEHKITE
jgi:DNA-binding NtrC family response regulator